MKAFYSRTIHTTQAEEELFRTPSLREDMEKTRIALEIAYAGFDNATDNDMIDCYIYEINSLLKRYKHLNDLASRESAATLIMAAPIRNLLPEE